MTRTGRVEEGERENPKAEQRTQAEQTEMAERDQQLEGSIQRLCQLMERNWKVMAIAKRYPR
jgi:hypothetical protein